MCVQNGFSVCIKAESFELRVALWSVLTLNIKLRNQYNLKKFNKSEYNFKNKGFSTKKKKVLLHICTIELKKNLYQKN